MDSTSHYELAVAWTWMYDQEFIAAIEQAAREESIRVYFITR